MTKKTAAGLSVNEDLIRQLAGLLDDTGLGEIELQEGDSKVRVAKPGTAAAVVPQAPAPAAAPAAPSASASDDAVVHPGAITSPMVGVCYMKPDPDSPVFCAEGDTVKQGDTLLLIEAMKVFNPISAPRSGTVTKILVTDGTPVEFGEPLVVIE